eukprot:1148039-Rhodomonas_salina.1
MREGEETDIAVLDVREGDAGVDLDQLRLVPPSVVSGLCITYRTCAAAAAIDASTLFMSGTAVSRNGGVP